jgi:hypothetical protein
MDLIQVAIEYLELHKLEIIFHTAKLQNWY